MITPISLVNIHQHTQLHFFLVMKTFRISSLCNFQICSIVLLIIVTIICYIPRTYFLYDWKFILFDYLQTVGPP